MAKKLAVFLCLTGIVLSSDLRDDSAVRYDTPQQQTPADNYNSQSLSKPLQNVPLEARVLQSYQTVNNVQDSRTLSNSVVASTEPKNSVSVSALTASIAVKRKHEEAHQHETARSPTAKYVYGVFVPYAMQSQQQYVSAPEGNSQAVHNPDQIIQAPLSVQTSSSKLATPILVPPPQLAPVQYLETNTYRPSTQNVLTQTRILVPQPTNPEAVKKATIEAHQSITSHLSRTSLPHVVPTPVISNPIYHLIQGVANGPRVQYVPTSVARTGHRAVKIVPNTIKSPEILNVKPQSAIQIALPVAQSLGQHIQTQVYRPEVQYVTAPLAQFQPSFDSRAAVIDAQKSISAHPHPPFKVQTQYVSSSTVSNPVPEGNLQAVHNSDQIIHEPLSTQTPLPDFAASTLGPLLRLAQVHHLKKVTHRPKAHKIRGQIRKVVPQSITQHHLRTPHYVVASPLVSYPVYHHAQGVPGDHHVTTPIEQTGHRSVQILSKTIESPEIVMAKPPYAAHFALPVAPSSSVHQTSQSEPSLNSRPAIIEAHQSISDHPPPHGKVHTQYVSPSAGKPLCPVVYSAAESQKHNPVSERIPVRVLYPTIEAHNLLRHGDYSRARTFSSASDVSSVRYDGVGFSYGW